MTDDRDLRARHTRHCAVNLVPHPLKSAEESGMQLDPRRLATREQSVPRPHKRELEVDSDGLER